eukprot:jgi/Mesvir1/267/Mv13605-RA.1
MWALPESATWIVIGLLGVLGVAGLGMLGYGAFKTLLGDYDEKRYREEEAKWKKLMIAGGVMVAVGVIGLGAGTLPWERLADWWHSRNRVAPVPTEDFNSYERLYQEARAFVSDPGKDVAGYFDPVTGRPSIAYTGYGQQVPEGAVLIPTYAQQPR